ncbi:MAG TPA: restriction endonuclease subunit S [Bacteroidales bacterium]|nr:restriction endonuclease subunit S [Bacteroidales bacterium]
MKWERINLGSLGTMKYGKMPNKQDLVDEGYPVFSGYRITGFHKEYLFKEPQLIVVARGVGGTGDVKISPPFCYLTNLSIAIQTNDDLVDRYFLKYRLSVQNLRSLDSGAAQSQITIGSLEQFETTIPPLPTQRRIASILSAYDSLIENNLKRIKLLEEKAFLRYKGIVKNEKLEEFTIEEVCDTLGGGTPATGDSRFWDDGEIQWFSPTDLTRQYSIVLLDSEKKITELGLQKSSAKIVPPKTILMTSRASIGYFGLINKPAATNQGFITLYLSMKITEPICYLI